MWIPKLLLLILGGLAVAAIAAPTFIPSNTSLASTDSALLTPKRDDEGYGPDRDTCVHEGNSVIVNTIAALCEGPDGIGFFVPDLNNNHATCLPDYCGGSKIRVPVQITQGETCGKFDDETGEYTERWWLSTHECMELFMAMCAKGDVRGRKTQYCGPGDCALCRIGELSEDGKDWFWMSGPEG
ncbi:hypothetical protein LTR37_018451 [Vermiconidia calcicola]|uniref:Uncharacterized protein n=1 Tax=Vermiconidia calcicola TaxID=1690605 RepID=A0ACC3MGZ0_9PEZI|nr:hypothetical protein LTR37_018451 [Vermiconidia calcicola]